MFYKIFPETTEPCCQCGLRRSNWWQEGKFYCQLCKESIINSLFEDKDKLLNLCDRIYNAISSDDAAQALKFTNRLRKFIKNNIAQKLGVDLQKANQKNSLENQG